MYLNLTNNTNEKGHGLILEITCVIVKRCVCIFVSNFVNLAFITLTQQEFIFNNYESWPKDLFTEINIKQHICFLLQIVLYHVRVNLATVRIKIK